MGYGGDRQRGLAADLTRLERRCCACGERAVTTLLQWVPKALFAAGGIFVLLGAVLVGLGSMERVQYPQGLAVGIPLCFFGVVFLVLCVVTLVIRHKRESKGIGVRTFDSYSKEALNLSSAASYSSSALSSALSSPRAVQYFPSHQSNARSSIEAAPPGGAGPSAGPRHFRAVTGTPIDTTGAITDTGTGFYYVADVTNPGAGYYVHSETGDTYHVNETTGQYYLVDQNAGTSTADTFSLSSYQASTRPGSAMVRPGSAYSGTTSLSAAPPAQRPQQRRVRPSSSVGRRQMVQFEGKVSVSETDKHNKTSHFRQQLREGGDAKPRPKIFTDPFGDDGLTFRTRPASARPGTGRARSGVGRSQEPTDTNVVTADVHVHAGKAQSGHVGEEEDDGNAERPSITKIYVQSEGKSLRKNRHNTNSADTDSSLGNSISSLPRGRTGIFGDDTKSLDSNLSATTKNRFSENFGVRT